MPSLENQLIYDPSRMKRPMRVACFLSGTGSNAIKIIEKQRELEKEGSTTYEVVLLFSDTENPDKCRIRDLSEDYQIPHIIHDTLQFHKDKGTQDKKDLILHQEYDQNTVKALEPFRIDLVTLTGYVPRVTQPLLSRYNGKIVNVRPAGLSMRGRGKHKYTDLQAVKSAILAGEKQLYSTTHIVRENRDQEEILLVSEGVAVELPKGVNLTQLALPENKKTLQDVITRSKTSLEEKGDWKVYPLTIQWIAQGRIALGDKGSIHLDGKPLKDGFRLGN